MPAPKQIIGPIYHPGEKLLLSRRHVFAYGPQGRQTVAEANFDMSIRVATVDGSKRLADLLLKRVRLTTSAPGRAQTTVDTDDDATLDSKEGRLVAPLKEMSFMVILDASGNLVDFARGGGTNANEDERARDVNAAMMEMFRDPSVYLPVRAVAVGASWTVKRKVMAGAWLAGDSTGDLQENTTCTFASIEQTDAGPVAVITLAGRTDGPRDNEINPALAGEVRVGLGKSTFVSEKIEIAGAKKDSDDKLTVVFETTLSAAPAATQPGAK
jgi:hypothetical protein